MDPKGKRMVVNDKEKESLFHEPRDDKPTDSGSSHKKRDGKKKRRIMCLGEYVMNLPLFTMLAILLLQFFVRMKK
jgi:hypothetical protein